MRTQPSDTGGEVGFMSVMPRPPADAYPHHSGGGSPSKAARFAPGLTGGAACRQRAYATAAASPGEGSSGSSSGSTESDPGAAFAKLTGEPTPAAGSPLRPVGVQPPRARHHRSHSHSRTQQKEKLKARSMAAMGYGDVSLGSIAVDSERREVLDLVYDHWPDVCRIRKHLDYGTGYVPAAAFCKAVLQELSLRRDGDARILARLVLDCLIDPGSDPAATHPLAAAGEGYVDFARLKMLIQRPANDDAWKNRYRAQGIMPKTVQAQTVGIDIGTRTQYRGPPYAVSRDGDNMKDLVSEYLAGRRGRMRDTLSKFGRTGNTRGQLTYREFKDAMGCLDSACANEHELSALIECIDPKRTGWVNVDDFLDRFALEYFKGRSMRMSMGKENHDGNSHTLQWPASMDPEFRKKDVMDALRANKTKRLQVPTSRSSRLRREHGRAVRECTSKYDAYSTAYLNTSIPTAYTTHARSMFPACPAPAHPNRSWHTVRPTPRYTTGSLPDPPSTTSPARFKGTGSSASQILGRSY